MDEILITADELRALAEEADGRRTAADDSTRFKIVASRDGRRRVRLAEASSSEPEVALRLRTTRRSNPKQIDVIVPGVVFRQNGLIIPGEERPGGETPAGETRLDNYARKFDALFWSEAAVDKFLVPYYSSLMPVEDVKSRIVDPFTSDTVLAYVHLPDSEWVTGTSPTTPGLASAQPDAAT